MAVGAPNASVNGYGDAGAAFAFYQAPRPTTLTSCDSTDLLQAIATAEGSGGNGTVLFACSGTITLSSPIVVVAPENLSLDASSALGSVTLSGGNSTQVFIVEGGDLNLTDVDVASGLSGGTDRRRGQHRTIKYGRNSGHQRPRTSLAYS